jgi:hypothetical protein
MDDGHFDALARSLIETRSRRGIARLLGVVALVSPATLLALPGIDARNKKKKKKKGKKNKKHGKQCTNGETRCDDDCVDLEIDPKHCGDCDEACDPGQDCKLGECIDICVPVCAAPEACCLAECVDLQTNATNCGECGKACAATELCRNAQCIPCTDPMALCSVGGEQTCVDLSTDANHCGECGHQCPKDPVLPSRNFACQERECVCTGTVCDNGLCCPAGFNSCLRGGEACCPDGYTEDCGNGRCCPTGFTCGGTCGEECCP